MNLKQLLSIYGVEKLNTFTKYASILTLHDLGDRGSLKETFTTDIKNEKMFATEKIDGTNGRLIFSKDDFIIGSRKELLFHSQDLLFNPALGIVEQFFKLGLTDLRDFPELFYEAELIVVYGEFYGGNIGRASKNYAQNAYGFRVFDVATYNTPDLKILNESLPTISAWRERKTDDGIVYGQKFLTRNELNEFCLHYQMAPSIDFDLGDMSHSTILNNMNEVIGKTKVALEDGVQGKAEGLVLRNEDRTKIVKIRFEDYERTLR